MFFLYNRPCCEQIHSNCFLTAALEICLNPRKPASVITVISPKSVLPQWGLPEVSYQFITRY